MVHSAFRRVAEIARRAAATRTFLICVVVAAAAVSFFAGAHSYRHQTWPFGQGYYAAVLRLLGLPPPSDPIGVATVDSTFHRLRTRLFAGIAEAQLEGIKTEGHIFKFLHFGVFTGVLSFGELDLGSGEIAIRPAGTVEAVTRGTGILWSPSDGKIYVSYVTVDAASCASMKLDEIELIEGAPLRQIPVFQSTCVEPPHALFVSGGRMQIDSAGRFYLTVGDFGRTDLVEDPATSFGKILSGKPGEGFAVHSRGHRNSQGLLWDQEFSRLLATEHGPQGGDEINLILPDTHYGWPYESYGRRYTNPAYKYFVWTDTATYGSHDRYRKPLYSYVPSIGIGQIRKMPRDASEFAHWRGQYFVAGMASRSLSLMRLVIEDDRVIVNEPLPLGRIRDFVFTETGVLVASRPDGMLVVRHDKDNVD